MTELFDLDSLLKPKEMTQPKKKDEKPKDEKPKKKAEAKTEAKTEKVKTAEKTGNKYKYPFKVYLAGRFLDIDHIFEENQEYAESEISAALLEHQYYEFAGKVTYDYREQENVLIPTFQQHKKG